LRVGARERIHTPETEAVETAWLRAFHDETDIDIALPIANQSGALHRRPVTVGRPPTLCPRR
jgi:hypothetical protein